MPRLMVLITAAVLALPSHANSGLENIEHLIVIYQENHSFDNYFGDFPGADGIANAGPAAIQVDKADRPYPTLPRPLAEARSGLSRQPDARFPPEMPNRPFLFNQFISPTDHTGPMVHSFYREQYQINGGRMDKFIAWGDSAGMVMGYWDLAGLPLHQLAQEYTLADHFFHAAFGGSFLNHHWLICACTPTFPDAPESMISRPFPNDPDHFQDNNLTPDGYVVNTSHSVNTPHPASARPEALVPTQTAPTIGERLTAAGVTWAWYAGGWNDAIAGNPDRRFQFHHQPFVYYATYADDTPERAIHLKDEQDFLSALQTGDLPAVSFIKPIGLDNEHPSYTTVARGQEHVMQLVRAVQASPYWPNAAIIITYDENGGAWDHVAPPVGDRWGPGTRVPAVVVSPWARRGYIDRTVYDTTSILKFITTRWGLQSLGARDAAAADLSAAFDFTLP